MAERKVTSTGKDEDGDITKLCGNFGVVTKFQAIQHIDNKIHSYYVHESGPDRVYVRVVNGSNGKYLRTDADSYSRNNLDNLPDC